MDRDLAYDLIEEFEDGTLPWLVRRDDDLRFTTGRRTISVIGPRRAGKTYFVFDIMGRLMDAGIEKACMIYLNVEDERLYPMRTTDLGDFLRYYYEIHPENRERTVYLFIDEIQIIEGWELFVRRIMDKENVQVVITGSSSRLLYREVATSMRGRSLPQTILPFSLKELLLARNVTVPDLQLGSRKRSVILNHLNDYLLFGGFPEVVLEDDMNDKKRLLTDILEIVLLRDIIERYDIANTKVLKVLFRSVLGSGGTLFSVRKFHNDLKSQGYRVSKNTLYEHIEQLKDAMAIIQIKKFSHSELGIERSVPKIYPMDVGFETAISGRTTGDFGRRMEIAVAIHLQRLRSSDPFLETYYWRESSSGREIDFVLVHGKTVDRLVQVCYDLADTNTKGREIEALLMGSKMLDCDDLSIITWDLNAEEVVEGKTITYVPLWKWLLGTMMPGPPSDK